MTLADGIRKHGFRKRYAREPLQSHAHMVLAFLCVINAFAAFTAFEAASQWHGLQNELLNGAAIVTCTDIGLRALRRYLRLLTHAESVAHQADCPHCAACGRLELIKSDAAGNEVDVRCCKCGRAWQISA